MKLYIVRHAESRRNAQEKSGEDAVLSKVGKEQARRLGSYFHKAHLNRVYCSTLKRAKETLREIKLYIREIPITYTEKIIEHKMGVYGKAHDDWSSYIEGAKKEGVPLHLFKPKYGDSFMETYERAGEFYKWLLKEHHGESILLIGHGIFSLYLILNALDLDLSEQQYYKLNNASVSTLEIDESGKVKNFHVNDYNHLIREGMKKSRILNNKK